VSFEFSTKSPDKIRFWRRFLASTYPLLTFVQLRIIEGFIDQACFQTKEQQKDHCDKLRRNILQFVLYVICYLKY
jgi:hypothetical protein